MFSSWTCPKTLNDYEKLHWDFWEGKEELLLKSWYHSILYKIILILEVKFHLTMGVFLKYMIIWELGKMPVYIIDYGKNEGNACIQLVKIISCKTSYEWLSHLTYLWKMKPGIWTNGFISLSDISRPYLVSRPQTSRSKCFLKFDNFIGFN